MRSRKGRPSAKSGWTAAASAPSSSRFARTGSRSIRSRGCRSRAAEQARAGLTCGGARSRSRGSASAVQIEYTVWLTSRRPIRASRHGEQHEQYERRRPPVMASHSKDALGHTMIDLRSDTVTRPTPAMLAAMSAAETGDDVWGDDPTVLRLQATLAERTGKEAGLFFPSGTQSNLAALMAHCARGDEYIVGQLAHTYKYEGGGAAVLGSIQPQPLENAPDGSIPLEKIAAAIKPIDNHFARTRLLALENTIGGKVLPESYVAQAVQLARQHGLSAHLDGARVFNAAVASGKP